MKKSLILLCVLTTGFAFTHTENVEMTFTRDHLQSVNGNKTKVKYPTMRLVKIADNMVILTGNIKN